MFASMLQVNSANLGCVDVACLEASRDESSGSEQKHYQNSSATYRTLDN